MEVDIQKSNSWISKFQEEPDNDSIFSQYILSYYWACITMITVGYGDIIPTNTIERVYVVIATLISCGVFAYTVNSIGSIFQTLNQKQDDFQKKMILLSDYMKKRGMSMQLQMKVKKYFEYLQDESNQNPQMEDMIMKELTGNLKIEVMNDIYGRLLKNKKIFNLNFSELFLYQLSLIMKEKRFGPEEIIYKQNEQVDNIYFIIEGNVDLFLTLKNTWQQQLKVREMGRGDVFGESEFFADIKALYNAQSQNVVTVAYISKEQFCQTMQNFPLDFERFCMMKDNYNLYNSSRGMAQKCFGCSSYNHQLKNCPFVQRLFQPQQVIQKYEQMNKKQDRQQQQRRDYKITNALSNVELLKETAIQYLINNCDNERVDSLLNCIENINSSHEQKPQYDQSQILDEENDRQQSQDQPIIRTKKKHTSLIPNILQYSIQESPICKNSSQSENSGSLLHQNSVENIQKNSSLDIIVRDTQKSYQTNRENQKSLHTIREPQKSLISMRETQKSQTSVRDKSQASCVSRDQNNDQSQQYIERSNQRKRTFIKNSQRRVSANAQIIISQIEQRSRQNSFNYLINQQQQKQISENSQEHLNSSSSFNNLNEIGNEQQIPQQKCLQPVGHNSIREPQLSLVEENMEQRSPNLEPANYLNNKESNPSSNSVSINKKSHSSLSINQEESSDKEKEKQQLQNILKNIPNELVPKQKNNQNSNEEQDKQSSTLKSIDQTLNSKYHQGETQQNQPQLQQNSENQALMTLQSKQQTSNTKSYKPLFLINDFDKFKNYTNYYPNNNLELILKKYFKNNIQTTNQKKLEQLTLKHLKNSPKKFSISKRIKTKQMLESCSSKDFPRQDSPDLVRSDVII